MLALIAGTGRLPPTLHRALSARGAAPLVCAMSGFEPELDVDITFHIEHLGSFLNRLGDEGVTRVCMAGAVSRPDIDPSRIDGATAPLVPALQEAMAKGDDGTLRAIVALFEERGIAVVGAAALLPTLLPAPGVPTRSEPTDAERKMAELGESTIAELGARDVGQACLLREGRLIAAEGAAGTAAMMESTSAKGAVLFKAPKPKQDRRVDLPLIGPDTARQAITAGLNGIIIEAGGVMVLEFDEVCEKLDAGGLFLWVRP